MSDSDHPPPSKTHDGHRACWPAGEMHENSLKSLTSSLTHGSNFHCGSAYMCHATPTNTPFNFTLMTTPPFSDAKSMGVSHDCGAARVYMSWRAKHARLVYQYQEDYISLLLLQWRINQLVRETRLTVLKEVSRFATT